MNFRELPSRLRKDEVKCAFACPLMGIESGINDQITVT